MKPCPECKEPPHYHSWCTLCAQLFRVTPVREQLVMGQLSRWQSRREFMKREMRAAHSGRLTAKQAAAKIGCTEQTLCRWRRIFRMPCFTRKTRGRRAHG